MSSVTRSMEEEATTADGAGRVARKRVAFSNGMWGMAALVASEGTLFGLLFGTYFYLRFRAVHWPPPGIEDPKTVVPLIMVGVLALTSIPMQIAATAAGGARVGLARLALVVALVVQSGYFAMEMHLFMSDLDKFTPQQSAYGSIYYTLLGADHFHVFVGLLLSVWLLAKLVGGLTSYRLTALRGIVFYWHFVNLLTLLVAGATLSPAI